MVHRAHVPVRECWLACILENVVRLPADIAACFPQIPQTPHAATLPVIRFSGRALLHRPVQNQKASMCLQHALEGSCSVAVRIQDHFYTDSEFESGSETESVCLSTLMTVQIVAGMHYTRLFLAVHRLATLSQHHLHHLHHRLCTLSYQHLQHLCTLSQHHLHGLYTLSQHHLHHRLCTRAHNVADAILVAKKARDDHVRTPMIALI